MLQAQAEDALPDPRSEFHETLEPQGPGMLMEASKKVATRYEALVGALRAAVEVGLLKGCGGTGEDRAGRIHLTRFGVRLRVSRRCVWPPCG